MHNRLSIILRKEHGRRHIYAFGRPLTMSSRTATVHYKKGRQSNPYDGTDQEVKDLYGLADSLVGLDEVATDTVVFTERSVTIRAALPHERRLLVDHSVTQLVTRRLFPKIAPGGFSINIWEDTASGPIRVPYDYYFSKERLEIARGHQ